MEFYYNRKQAELLRVMKSKAEKKNIHIFENGKNVSVSLAAGKFKNGEDSIPVTFKGCITENGAGCSFKGKFSYGFYLYTLVIVAAILILVRFLWSVYQKQAANMILCGIVTVLLAIIMIVVRVKAKKAKILMEEFLNDLNLK